LDRASPRVSVQRSENVAVAPCMRLSRCNKENEPPQLLSHRDCKQATVREPLRVSDIDNLKPHQSSIFAKNKMAGLPCEDISETFMLKPLDEDALKELSDRLSASEERLSSNYDHLKAELKQLDERTATNELRCATSLKATAKTSDRLVASRVVLSAIVHSLLRGEQATRELQTISTDKSLELERATEKLLDLEAQIETLRTQKAQLEQENKELECSAEAFRNEGYMLKDEVLTLKAKLERNQGDNLQGETLDAPDDAYFTLLEENRELALSLSMFKQQCESLKVENRHLSNSFADLEENFDRLSGKHAQLIGHSNLKQRIRHLEQLKAERKQLLVTVKHLQQRLLQLEADGSSSNFLECLATQPLPHSASFSVNETSLRRSETERCKRLEGELQRINVNFSHFMSLIEWALFSSSSERPSDTSIASMLNHLRELVLRTPAFQS
jgi:hypothetical protein